MSEHNQFGLTSETVSKIQDVFSQFNEIDKVILYGSRAKGNFKPGSDIDLTIMSSQTELSLLFKIVESLDDLLLPYKIDLSFYSTLDNENLRDHINRVGVEFYKRRK